MTTNEEKDSCVLVEKKNLKKSKGKIMFDEEFVTKHEAQNLMKVKDNKSNNTNNLIADQIQSINNKKQKKKKRKLEELNHLSLPDTDVNDGEISKKNVMQKKKKNNIEAQDELEDTVEEVLDNDKPEGEKKQSIRAQKRTRHLKLLEEKKLKSELNMQQKCLNYLSQWKHDKSTWKFKKLMQVWLLQNLYDDVKIPDEFWDTTIKYFNNAKGKVKEVLLTEALKIIENSDKNDDSSVNFKYERARHIVQNLQE